MSPSDSLGDGDRAREREFSEARGLLLRASMLAPFAWISLVLAFVSAEVIVADLTWGHAQRRWIGNLVWPLTALWAGPVALLAYYRWGREDPVEGPPTTSPPLAVIAGRDTTNCGSGFTLGDIVAELVVVAAPLTLFGRRIFGAWVYDFVFAFAFGILFQYCALQPMRRLPFAQRLKAVLKADALPLAAWQIGMYAWMAIATFAIFHHELDKSNPVFWLMMQIAMCFGFAVSYPVNRWMLRRGLKPAT